MRTRHPSIERSRKILNANRSLKEFQTLRRGLATPGSPLHSIPENVARRHLSPYLSGTHGTLNNQEGRLRNVVRRLGGTRRRTRRKIDP
jgi:hypothetical protein